jgi:hypothetical protein
MGAGVLSDASLSGTRGRPAKGLVVFGFETGVVSVIEVEFRFMIERMVDMMVGW